MLAAISSCPQAQMCVCHMRRRIHVVVSSGTHLRQVKAPRRVPFPMVGKVKHSFFGKTRTWTKGVEFNLRHFSTIWFGGKLQLGALTSRRWSPLCRVLHVCVYTHTHTHTQSLAVSSALVDGGSPSLKLPSDQEATLIGRRSARFIEI